MTSEQKTDLLSNRYITLTNKMDPGRLLLLLSEKRDKGYFCMSV